MEENYPVKINNLKFKYKKSENYILNDINLKVKKGEIIAITGLSGCGKTSFIYCINGIIPKRYSGDFEGEVLINGKNIGQLEIPEIATMIGTVFQDPDTQIVFSNVDDEIAFSAENLCVEKNDILKRVDHITKLLNIEKLRGRNPNDLSGGEKQLVVIASVLSLGINILILDECMSQVDKAGKVLIKKAILKLKEEGKTIIMVEHEEENLDIVDKIYTLKKGVLHYVSGDI
ncbi:ABC transporter ATP-binding protein [Clostridium sp. DL1XJH146]